MCGPGHGCQSSMNAAATRGKPPPACPSAAAADTELAQVLERPVRTPSGAPPTSNRENHGSCNSAFPRRVVLYALLWRPPQTDRTCSSSPTPALSVRSRLSSDQDTNRFAAVCVTTNACFPITVGARERLVWLHREGEVASLTSYGDTSPAPPGARATAGVRWGTTRISEAKGLLVLPRCRMDTAVGSASSGQRIPRAPRRSRRP